MRALIKRDPRVDAYIAKAPDYAKPILEKLRALIHEADTELVEAIKWGAPTFVKDGLVCSFHAFKQHVALWFHKGALLIDPKRMLNVAATVSMRAAHFREPSDVAAPAMRALLKQAVKLNAAGVKAPRRAAAARPSAAPTKWAGSGKQAVASRAASSKAPRKRVAAIQPTRKVATTKRPTVVRRPTRRA